MEVGGAQISLMAQKGRNTTPMLLCVRCDKLCHLLYQCPSKTFWLIIFDDRGFCSRDEDETHLENATETSVLVECTQVELLLLAVIGIIGPKTLKVPGELQGKSIVVLMDSGLVTNLSHKVWSNCSTCMSMRHRSSE